MAKKFNLSALIFMIIFLLSCEEKPTIPILTTNAATEITTISAVSGGVITNDGGAPVISKGICWNTSDDPTTDNNKTTETGEFNSFTSNLTGLSPKTLYYIRAYATNSAGTGYGESVSFTSLGDTPASVIASATNIAIDSAVLNGSVNPNSLSTTVSFEWGTTTAYGNTITARQSPVTGDASINVSVKLTDLAPGTVYHYRIKAENSLGITYSSDMTFSTLGDVPSVTTLNVTNLQTHSATLNSSVNPNYLSTSVTFEWGTTTSYGNSVTPTQSPVTGSTSVNVNTDLTGLTAGTTYHFRIVATNELGTTYGNDMTFKTLGDLPAVTLLGASEITLNTATLAGSVNPNYLPTTVSFEWGTSTVYNNASTSQNIGNGNSIVDVIVDLSGLVPGTTYHYRINATNELGTTTSEDSTFTTFALIDTDNNYYHSVNIGTQIWMKENLKTSKLNDNTDIPIVTDNTEWGNLSTPGYCWYNNEIINKDSYGAMYNWFVVETGMLCPTGWHVPNNSEWTTLINYLGGTSIAGGKLKETNLLHWQTPNTAATDESGFTGLPGGNRDLLGPFYNLGQRGYWWSTVTESTTNAWYMHLAFNTSDAILIDYGKNMGFSVRCIKD